MHNFFLAAVASVSFGKCADPLSTVVRRCCAPVLLSSNRNYLHFRNRTRVFWTCFPDFLSNQKRTRHEIIRLFTAVVIRFNHWKTQRARTRLHWTKPTQAQSSILLDPFQLQMEGWRKVYWFEEGEDTIVLRFLRQPIKYLDFEVSC